jgi:hypothetical protein
MEILTLIDQGELWKAEQQITELTKEQTVDVKFRIWNPGGIRISSGGGGGIPVAAAMSGIPTAAQIAKQIGTVRIPLDTYVRSAPRITGLRD